MKSTHRWQQLLLNSLAIILGNALYSLAVALFLEPAGLITGGATGIALAFGRLTGLSPPATPEGEALLRTSYMATHTEALLDEAMDIMAEVLVKHE